MSPREITLHARRFAGYRYDAFVWNAARPLWRRSWEPPKDRIVVRDAAPSHPLLLGDDRVAGVRRTLADSDEAIVAEAERRIGARIDAPDRWPDRHGRLIDYRHSTAGDPKLAWEVERCQELPLLALAARLTGEARFAEAAAARLRAWFAGHRPGRGISWANAYEPAIRAISLAVAFDALRDHVPSVADEEVVVRGFWQHGRWIVRDRSRYSSANNHLVGELVGLLAIGVLVPELRDSQEWRELAIRELSREAGRQILPDGSSAEQSFAYGLFTIDLLLTAAAFLGAGGHERPQAIVSALERSADALALVVDAREPEPAFGDDDDGRTLLLDATEKRTARRVAASLAAFLGHGGARRLAEVVDPTAALLFGADGVARFEACDPAPPPRDGVLPDGGVVVTRRGATRMLFDTGSLGYLSIAAHGHADALQLLVTYSNQELVTDPGTGSYLANVAVRDRLRGTAAHATVCVDGVDQSQSGGPFLWTRHADARLVTVDLEAGVAVGEHGGYTALPDPVVHRRAVVTLGDEAVLVVDRLEGVLEHTFVQTWPLHPALEPSGSARSDGVVVVASSHGVGLALAAASSAPSELVVARDGLWSRRLEQWQPTWVISQRVVASGCVHLAAVLLPVPGRLAPISIEVAQPGPACVVKTRIGDAEHVVQLELGGAEPIVRR